ncbi:MAG: Stealth CR1 domain-containing protein [Alphaproteobacteria bacterium]|nr:Stealth CR1 domain-containing protein [Alphaproteobacteria bacterium]
MKIDLVYLWVDGSDPKWRARKNAALGGKNMGQATRSTRWRDNDELKHSLRSMEEFAPWINHVFIITDDQRPEWLNNNPKVTIVDQNSIIEKKFQPVFNSVAVEFNIYKIPKLAEHFLYANDDMFFGRPVKPDFFFDAKGNPIVIMKERKFQNRVSSSMWKNTKSNALKFVRDKFGRIYNLGHVHAIEPMRKSYMKEMAEKYREEIFLPNMTTFRDRRNVQRMVMPLIDNALGRNTITLNWRVGKNRMVYDARTNSAALRAWHILTWFFSFSAGFIKYDCYDKRWRVWRILKKYKPTLFVLNDVEDDSDAATKAFLSETFPKISKFEKKTETKIDLVYMWVDGSDKKWQAKRNAALVGKNLGTTVSANRWRDNDELKYSLRSAEKFAPWINHIYIVTDNQRPKWLKDNKKITIVDHKKIIDKKFLPLFNSSAIEYNVHKIPGLSEHFLFANDDMFFGRLVKPNFFFDPSGDPIVIMKERRFHNRAPGGLWRTMSWNGLRLARALFRKKYNLSFVHAIEPMRKSYMRDNLDNYRREIFLPTMTTFRSGNNVQRVVLPLIDNQLGRNDIVLGWRDDKSRIKYDVLKDSSARRGLHLARWLMATILGYVKYDCYDKQRHIKRMVKKFKPATFTVNDDNQGAAAIRKFLENTFPKKSKFEL